MKNQVKFVSIAMIILLYSSPNLAQMHDHSSHGAPAPAMKPETAKTNYLAAPQEFKKQLDGVFKAYLALQVSLSEDSLDKSKANAKALDEKLGAVNMKLLTNMETHMRWMSMSESISKNAKQANSASNIKEARTAFRGISNSMINTAEQFGTPDGKPLYVANCSMAKADWIQIDKKIKNPYYGKSMLTCGTVKETISAEGIK